MKLSKDDKFYQVKLTGFKAERQQDLEKVEAFETYKKCTRNVQKNHIGKCFMYQNLADTDSTSLFFVFICSLDCTVSEKDSRKILFEVMIASKIFQRLDLSDDFWE